MKLVQFNWKGDPTWVNPQLITFLYKIDTYCTRIHTMSDWLTVDERIEDVIAKLEAFESSYRVEVGKPEEALDTTSHKGGETIDSEWLLKRLADHEANLVAHCKRLRDVVLLTAQESNNED